MRPAFLDQHSWWTRTPRESMTRAEYASPVTQYRHERSWRVCDRFTAGVLLGVLAALAMGVL